MKIFDTDRGVITYLYRKYSIIIIIDMMMMIIITIIAINHCHHDFIKFYITVED